MSKAKDRRYFYSSHIAVEMVADLALDDGFISHEDVYHYRAQWLPAIQHDVGDKRIYSAPVPGAGALLGALAAEYPFGNPVLTAKRLQVPEFTAAELHRLVELLKFTISGLGVLGDRKEGRTKQEFVSQDILAAFQSLYNEQAPLKTYADYKATESFPEDFGGAFLGIRDKYGNALSIVSSLNAE
ncbi:hypothetical protein V5799_006160 [Amblyomma americanum]|uniref:Uncharacterized protein n=1 Tax=Amblyomma americanum TaxID=6943 RepID=A0AAQ4DX58_AMBAM